MSTEKITLGAGCFWCIENIFKRINGVNSVVSGYANGDTKNPTYEQICSGKTNHVEVIQIEYDSTVINLDTIFTVFFAIHDPTTLNRQGNDVGTQYRSSILFDTVQQQQTAHKKIAELNSSRQFKDNIVTEVESLSCFYSAEDYHQNYYENNKNNGYCQFVVAKKIQQFLQAFSHLLKSEPVAKYN